MCRLTLRGCRFRLTVLRKQYHEPGSILSGGQSGLMTCATAVYVPMHSRMSVYSSCFILLGSVYVCVRV